MTETGHIVEDTLLLMMVSTSLYSSAMITAYHNEEQESRKIKNKIFPTFRKNFPALKKKILKKNSHKHEEQESDITEYRKIFPTFRKNFPALRKKTIEKE